jgi:hypothetical protein
MLNIRRLQILSLGLRSKYLFDLTLVNEAALNPSKQAASGLETA